MKFSNLDNRSLIGSRKLGLQVLASGLLCIWMILVGVSAAHATPDPGPSSGGTPVTIDGISFVQVAAGGNHSLGLTSAGTVFAWGFNAYGQLGNGTTEDSSVPVPVLDPSGQSYLSGVTSIAAGKEHSLAVSESGVFAWGRNQAGQLGDNRDTDSSLPVHVTGVGGNGYLSNVISVSGGREHSLALTSSGVFAWGSNEAGQLGDGNGGINGDVSWSPVQVKGLNGVGLLSGASSISAGSYHSLASTPSGVVAWGNNFKGQLGDGTTTDSSSPVEVSGLGVATSISAGSLHSLAMTSTGVFAWGFNGTGELGDGSTTDSSIPVHVKSVDGTGFLSDVTHISAGGYFSVAATTTGVFAWGFGSYGQLGDGNSTSSPLPVQVQGIGGYGYLAGITAISAGGFHSLVLAPSNVYAWGNGAAAQLGDGTRTSSSVPLLSANLGPITNVLFGSTAGTALSQSGSTWSVVSPAGSAGTVVITGEANIFGGTTPGNPSTARWPAGTFTYEDSLANTGSPDWSTLSIVSLSALLAGLVLIVLRKKRTS